MSHWSRQRGLAILWQSMIALIEQHRSRLFDLCRKYRVRRLDLFGSAAKGDFRVDGSDLDFVVEFENLTIDDAADRFLGLLIDLEDLFGRKVDLVMLSAIRNPYFRQAVDLTRVPLYAA